MMLVSDAEVLAAKETLDKLSELAGREQPVPDTVLRAVLEAAAMARMGTPVRVDLTGHAILTDTHY